ncbi:MAG: zinc ribbon domain-containing protein [Verrucomicrobiota bacterium]
MALPVTTLTCTQCGFVNEPERVYCHNCGSKLDRSLLPREDDGQAKDSIDRTRKRVKKLTNPGSQIVKREVRTAIKTVILSALAAFVLLAVRQPEGVPAAKGEPGGLRMVGSELADAVESPAPRRLDFTEAEINMYLRSAARAKAGGSSIPGVSFERAFVHFEGNLCRINIQQSIWGFPLYSGVLYRLDVKNGQFAPTQLGGNFGRVAISPFLMQHIDIAFQSLWTALKKDQAQMGKMQSITINKKNITFITKGAR